MNTELYTIFDRSRTIKMKDHGKNVKLYEFVLPNGRKGETPDKNQLFLDQIDGLMRSKVYESPTEVYHQGCIKTTTAARPGLNNIKLSKYKSILTTGPVNFKEHSGVGMGSPKKYAKPTGEVFGLELELIFEGPNSVENKLRFADWIATEFPQWVTERDGSLEDWCHNALTPLENSTLELVSPPLSLSHLSDAISRIFPKLTELNATVPSDWFGIHITSNIYGRHCKKSAVKFIRTVHDPLLQNFWKPVSRRGDSKSLTKYAPLLSYKGISDIELIGVAHADHYRAVYCRNLLGNAVELRIFRSTVDLNSILSIVELNALLARFSMSTAENWLEFVSFQASNRLLDFLEFCGVSNMLMTGSERDEAFAE